MALPDAPWGNREPSKEACWRRSVETGTCEVGSHPSGRTPDGVQDLAGNVWEWVQDPWSVKHKPSGLVDSARSGLRGGGWGSENPAFIRAASHLKEDANVSEELVGFRCARK